MADATIAARYISNPLATWTGAEKIPADNGAGTGVVGLASTLKTYMVGPPLALASGTITTSQPAISITQTWNAGGVTFNALLVNVTNTASAAASMLMDLQIGGVSMLNVDRSGNLNTNGYVSVGWIPGVTSGVKLVHIGGGQLGISDNSSSDYATFVSSGLRFSSTNALSWGSGTSSSSLDLALVRDAAGILAQRNSTNAQVFRIYKTYTDASNYERGGFDWQTTSNTLRIRSEALGSGTARIIAIDAFAKAGAAVAADIPVSTWALVRDTSGSTTKLIYNNAGTLMSVTLT